MILPTAWPTGSVGSCARPSSTAITSPSASGAVNISGASRTPRPIRYPPYFPRVDSTAMPASRRLPTYRRTARSVIPSRSASCSPRMPGEFCTISSTSSARAVGVVSSTKTCCVMFRNVSVRNAGRWFEV